MSDQLELAQIIDDLVENQKGNCCLDLIFQAMKPDEVPERHRSLYMELCGRTSIEFKPIEPSRVKELFCNFTYENGSEPLDLSLKRGRGRPGAYLRIPLPDELRQLVGLTQHNDLQDWDEALYGIRNTKELCDTVHLGWFKNQATGQLKRGIPLRQLRSIQGDSGNTIRARNERLGIKKMNNFFKRRVTSIEVHGLLLRCRGDCRFELEFPESVVSPNTSDVRRKKFATRYRVTKDGLKMASDEWQKAGGLGSFYECLRITGYLANSYELPGCESAVESNLQEKAELYTSLFQSDMTRYNAESVLA